MNTTQPTLAWTRQFGSGEFDHAEDIVADAFGNVYLTGHSRGKIGDSESQGGDDAWLAKLDSKGGLHWIKQLGSSGHDHANGMATDAFGHIYVAGHTTGELVEGQQQGGTDAWLAKFSPEGEQIWVQQIGSSEEDGAQAIAVARNGTVYVSGFSHGRIATDPATSDTGSDAWLAQFSAHGTLEWIKHFGTPADDVAYDLAIDASGNVFAAGYTRGRMATNQGDRGEKQIWVIKFDAAGEQLWLREFGSSGRDDEVRAIATDPEGNIYVTGMTYLERPNDNQLKRNVFLTKIRPNSSIHWSRFLGTEETDIAYGVATDPVGNIFIAGYTNSAVVEGEHKGDADAWLAKYNPDGEQQWVHQLGTSAEDKAEGITVDAFGNVYLAGFTTGRLTQAQAFSTRQDAWISKFYGNPDAELQFQLTADYLQQLNSRLARLELGHTDTPHNIPTDLIQLADTLVEGPGDGRISGGDADQLITAATQDGEISDENRKDLAFIFFQYNLTNPGKEKLEAVLAG